MKKQERKNDNRGFSLVELIVVVAIMAVLIGVLAPQYLRYVEKTRLQKDNSAIAEIVNAIKIAAADEDINEEIAKATTGLKISAATRSKGAAQVLNLAAITDGTQLAEELKLAIGDTVKTSSSTYANADADKSLEIEIKVDATTKAVSITVKNWYDSVSATAPTDKSDF